MNPFALWFTGLPRWARDLLIALGLFAGFLVFGKVWLEAHDMQVRKKLQDKQERETLKTRGAMVERTDEIVKGERTHADDALRARDHGEPVTRYDELSDDHRRLAEGRS